jgi:two-component system cell cycle response regulator DivK
MKTILVIEDDPKNLELIVRILTRSKFEVKVPSNAAEAIAMAIESRPDAILMDLALDKWNPPSDGCVLTQELRKITELATVPIIACSAASFPFEKENARAAGCSEFVEKPVDYLKLIARLKVITEG